MKMTLKSLLVFVAAVVLTTLILPGNGVRKVPKPPPAPSGSAR